ncbi:hypothetical protein [uncultured Shimia sp.]|uniref:hypothetical protein n=1 Tax=uncultured Shimia sp. TaxID=573152 RepID=UPI00262F0AF1|nr:hypothetical protein [uncultured Shimia sp.]
MAYYDDIANKLALDALKAQKLLDDHQLIQDMSDTLEATSSTLHEAFMTAVRVHTAEERGRAQLAERLKAAGYELKSK